MGKATLAWGLILPGNQGFLQSWVAVTVSRHPQSNKTSISGKHDLTHRGEESKIRFISSLSLAGHSSARRALEGSRGERMWPALGKRWWAAPTTRAWLSPAKGNNSFRLYLRLLIQRYHMLWQSDDSKVQIPLTQTCLCPHPSTHADQAKFLALNLRFVQQTFS